MLPAAVALFKGFFLVEGEENPVCLKIKHSFEIKGLGEYSLGNSGRFHRNCGKLKKVQ